MKIFYVSLFIIIFIGLSLFTSCDDENGEEYIGANPVIEETELNYSQINKTLFIAAKVIDPQGRDNIDSVKFDLYYLDSLSGNPGDFILSGQLYDDGQKGDIIKGDDVFSYLVDSSIIGSKEGYYKVFIQAFDLDGNHSEIEQAIEFVGLNSPPALYLVEAPEIFERGDTLLFKIRVSDPQGLEDIVAVIYSIKYPDGSLLVLPTFQMRDDGNFGDDYPGDGIYTVRQPYGKTGKNQGLFTFCFVAKDRHGALSDTLKVSIPNPGVTIIYPNGGESFYSGDTTEIKWESAYITNLVLQYTLNSDAEEPTFIVIDTVLASAKSYQWIIDSNIYADSCKIKVYDPNKISRYDLSDNSFSILP
jgi:hypothetical protein